MTSLGQQVFTESIFLTSGLLTYGSGTYQLVSSSRHSTTSQKSNLFKNLQYEGLAHWLYGQYYRGIYIDNSFLVFGYTGDWIFVRIPSPIVLTKFVFYRRTNFVSRAPGRWKCYGSMDGQDFREIPGGSEPVRLASTAYSSGFYTKIVNPVTPTPYMFIGWTISQLVGDESILNFGKIEIFGKEFASVRSTHYSINPGSTACTPCTSCPPGQFAITQCSEMADSVCQSCYAGTYSTVQGSASCARCAAGQYSTALGAVSVAVCLQCSAGQYSTALGAVSVATCLQCPPGRYSTALGAVSVAVCLQCSAGQYSTALGAVSVATCLQCSPGRYSTALGAVSVAVCLQCSPGRYSTALGAVSIAPCLQCSPGQYSTALGAVSVATCLQCSPGQFSTALGAVSVAACLACPPGQYSTAWGMTSSAQCDSCPPNTNASSMSTSLLDCVCLPGYTCEYTKRIHVVIRVHNTTASQFNLNLGVFLAAVAKAAGVGVLQVTVLNVTEANRRLMPGDDDVDDRVLYHLEVVDAVWVDTAALHSRTIAVAWVPAHALRVRRLDAV